MNIKFPLKSTVTKFYTIFNVGNFLNQQTRDALAMFDSHQNRNNNVGETVASIRVQIQGNMATTWVAACRRIQNALDLSGRYIESTVLEKIATCWAQREAWVVKNKKMLSDLRSPVMGEDREDFAYSDDEAIFGENDDINDVEF